MNESQTKTEAWLGAAPRRKAAPPTDLPTAPADYWSYAGEPQKRPTPADDKPANLLEKLGSAPFPRSGFPFVGFLASIYDHVMTQAESTLTGHETNTDEQGN